MDLLNYLNTKYGLNNPFSFDEISFKTYSLPWIKKELNKLVLDNRIIRFERGLYYIPEQTVFGLSTLSTQKVIFKKYLENSSGYFSGLSFANKLGLSTQMPNTIELYTNNEKSRVREIKINNQSIILRRARTEINEMNISVLSLLELMNSFPITYFNEERKNIIISYIKESNINRSQITEYSRFFPDLVMRNLIESEIIYEIA